MMIEISLEQYNDMAERLAELEWKLGEAVQVVRCKDCRYYDESLEVCRCSQWDLSRIEYPMVGTEDFCSYGERREP